jgi:tRNA(fMet)-specific endonuclease VapC
MYLLDTNTLIYYFKGKGKVAVRLLQVAPRNVAVSTITVYELEVGLAKSNAPRVRRDQLEDFLAFVTVLPFERKEAAAAAGIRADLERRGVAIGPLDKPDCRHRQGPSGHTRDTQRERVFQDPRADNGRLVCVMARICDVD